MPTSLPLTKYHRIYLVLREQLEEGLFANGLPSEFALSSKFGVGRVTVRRALEHLVQDGLIVREAGRGTRPLTAAERHGRHRAQAAATPDSRLSGLLGSIVSASRSTSVKVLEWRLIRASENMAVALQIAPGAPVRKIVRRRSTKAGPVSHITAYLPEHLMRGTKRSQLAAQPLLQLLQESGIELGRTRQTVSAQPADAEVATQLGVAIGTALLSVRRLLYDASETPVQLLHGLYRPDRYEYQMELSQVGSIEARVVAKEIPA